MKKHTRNALCLLAILLLSSACNSTDTETIVTTEQSTETIAAETEYSRIAEIGEYDFGGETFVIIDEDGSINVNTNTPDEALKGDIVNDTVAKRNDLFSELYNIEFQYMKISDMSQRTQTLRRSVMAGDNEYDLIFSSLKDSLVPLSTEGILNDLCTIEQLTLDAEWWSPQIYENCRVGGKLYFTTGDISPISYRSLACYYANETLLDAYQIPKDDIYAHVENGTWTIDVLHAYASDLDQDLNNDNTMYTDDDFFGILNEDNNLSAACFMTAAGINLSYIKDDGSLAADLNSEDVIIAIEKLSDTISNAKRKDNNSTHTAFMEDRVVFFMHFTAAGYNRYRDMKSDYMVLPLPKYDESQENYISMMNTYMSPFVAVPHTADIERAGVIMEAMAFWSKDELRTAGFDMALKEKGSRNEKDSVMLDTIVNAMYLDFNAFMEFGNSITPIANAIYKKSEYVSAAEKIKNNMNKAIEKFSDSWIGAGEMTE